jgi:asparagine synthase (glutamine-hydrolysing)
LSGIFGVYKHDRSINVPLAMQTMFSTMVHCGECRNQTWNDDIAGLGQIISINTNESRLENMPFKDANTNFAITAACRVDNRSELGRLLNINRADFDRIPDSEFIYRAYLKWGQECVNHIYGDWAFAVWNPDEHKLFLARDHHGNTSLYYYFDKNIFAFASSKEALLALTTSKLTLNELYLAQIITGWQAYHGENSIYEQIHRLPPSHCLIVTNSEVTSYKYWDLDSTPELNLSSRNDYVEAFLDIFDEAVRARLRSPNNTTFYDSDVATQLSAGLDSGSVTVTAEKFLREEGRKVTAFTAIPAYDTSKYTSNSAMGDETSLAQKSAVFANNLKHVLVKANHINPIHSIKLALDIHKEPIFGAANYYWLSELRKTVHEMGFSILLTGQNGNPGISWTGDIFSQSLSTQLHIMGWKKWLTTYGSKAKQFLRQAIPSNLLLTYGHSYLEQRHLRRYSAINLDFARRLKLLEQMNCSPDFRPPRTIYEQRRILQHGRSMTGCIHAEMGASFGLEIRDPTADARILAFTFSVPDRIYIDPKSGMNRWLIREAMKDRLPDEVRLNRRFGVQSADIVPRLRECTSDVDSVLKELSIGPAAQYVDVPYMYQTWQNIQTQDSPESSLLARTVVCRGIMAGLFVNKFSAK